MKFGAYFVLILAVALFSVSHEVRAVLVPETDLAELFVNWLCGYHRDDKLCFESNNMGHVFERVIHSIHDRAVEHVSSEKGMRETFKYFHTETELANPVLDQIIESTLDRHRPLIGTDLHEPANLSANPYPYFAFLPVIMGHAIPGGESISWESRCFTTNTARASLNETGDKVKVIIDVSGPRKHACSDYYVVYTIGHPELHSLFLHGKHTILIDLTSKSEAERWDVMTNGVRFLRFQNDPIQNFRDIISTASLFLQPLTHGHVGNDAAAHNLNFLEHYQAIRPLMKPRDPSPIQLPADYIQSGDFIGVIRLDGLDPMLGWAMGSSTGHTVIAMRSENDALYFCESTTKGKYWPTNGIQCTEYEKWIAQANAADYNTVVAPLREDLRAHFNATAAWEFFEAVEGVDYGFETLLFGWIDTSRGNYPCLPPDFSSRCLSWELIEISFSFLEKKIPVVSRIFRQAWNHRLNTRDLAIPELYHYAATQNITSIEIPAIPEDDHWLYKTTRNGKPVYAPAQVCCVFVCNMWKAGGIFDSIGRDLNCAEQTNFDLYNLDIFDHSRIGSARPDVCRERDPGNNLCQLTGKYTLHLNLFNTTEPYPRMHEKCGSLPPHYARPPRC